MPNSFGSYDLHISAPDLVPSLSDQSSSRSSLSSLSPSTTSWSNNCIPAYSSSEDRKAVDHQSQTLPLRPEPRRAFYSTLSSQLSSSPLQASVDLHLHQCNNKTEVSAASPDRGKALETFPSTIQQTPLSSSANRAAPIVPGGDSSNASHLATTCISETFEELQQAAKYATLAISQTSHHGASSDKEVPPERDSFGTNSPAASLLRVEEGSDYEAAPRLSTSSVESNSTSEVTTPENYHRPWSASLDGGSQADSQAATELAPRCLYSASSSSSSAPADASPAPSGSSSPPSAFATLGQKNRPGKLERLPSNATNTTARPSPPSSSSPSFSPAAESGAEKRQGLNSSHQVSTLPHVEDSALSSPASFSLQHAPEGSKSKLSPGDSRDKSAQNAPQNFIPPSYGGSMSDEARCYSPSQDYGGWSEGRVEETGSASGSGRNSLSGGSIAASAFNSRSRTTSGISARESLASPDSWRSLLPEHDPYFSPEGQSLARSSNAPLSPPRQFHGRFGHRGSGAISPSESEGRPGSAAQSSLAGSGNSSGVDRSSIASNDYRRMSNGSMMSQTSSFSLPGPTAVPPSSASMVESDSWRSLLPESDRFSLASASARLSSGNLQLGVPLTPSSPANSDFWDSPTAFEGTGHRAAFLPLKGQTCYDIGTDPASSAAARRHASFSSYEPHAPPQSAKNLHRGSGSAIGSGAGVNDGNWQTGHYPFVHPPACHSSGEASESANSRARSTNKSSVPSGMTLDSLSSQMSSRLSVSALAESQERESWPTSRGAHNPYGLSRSAYNSPKVAAGSGRLDTRDGVRSPPLGYSTTHTSSVTSVGEPIQNGILRNHAEGIMTTTTTTTTHTTTTTILPNEDLNTEHKTRKRPELSLIDPAGASASALSSDGTLDSGTTTSSTVKSKTPSCSVSTPMSPPSLPFLDHRPAPPETELAIETTKTSYVLITRLPGFSLDCITLATKHHRTLHIVADKWDAEGGGHFERRITFDNTADLRNVKAEFDGTILRVFVPRRSGTKQNSASSARF